MEVKSKDKAPNLYKDTFSEHQYLQENFCGDGYSIFSAPEKLRKLKRKNEDRIKIKKLIRSCD